MTRAMPIPETVTLHVPFRVIKRGGRKEMQLPAGAPRQGKTDNTLIKALARAFRWKRMLEQGEYGSLTELARAEKINLSYLGRVLRLTLLAPDIVEAILDGQQPESVRLGVLLKPLPDDWNGQCVHIGLKI